MLLIPKCENYISINAHISFYFLSLSTVIIHKFHSYTKILTLIPRIPIIPLILFPNSKLRLLQIAIITFTMLLQKVEKLRIIQTCHKSYMLFMQHRVHS